MMIGDFRIMVGFTRGTTSHLVDVTLSDIILRELTPLVL